MCHIYFIVCGDTYNTFLLLCNRSKKCYHVNQIAKLYEEEEKKEEDSDVDSDYDRAEDADVIDFNDPDSLQDLEDQVVDNNSDQQEEKKQDVGETKVHSHRPIPVPKYLRIKDELTDPDNEAYDRYTFSKETIPKSNSILRYVYICKATKQH